MKKRSLISILTIFFLTITMLVQPFAIKVAAAEPQTTGYEEILITGAGEIEDYTEFASAAVYDNLDANNKSVIINCSNSTSDLRVSFVDLTESNVSIIVEKNNAVILNKLAQVRIGEVDVVLPQSVSGESYKIRLSSSSKIKIIDQSGNGNHATQLGTGISLGIGKKGNMADFIDTTMLIDNRAKTIAFWSFTTTPITFNIGGQTVLVNPTNVDVWNHIALTIDNLVVTPYVNGVAGQITNVSATNEISLTGGKLDEMYVYDSILSNITTEMATPTVATIAYYPFEEGARTTVSTVKVNGAPGSAILVNSGVLYQHRSEIGLTLNDDCYVYTAGVPNNSDAFYELTFNGIAVRAFSPIFTAYHGSAQLFLDGSDKGVTQVPVTGIPESYIKNFKYCDFSNLVNGRHTVRLERRNNQNGHNSIFTLDYFEYDTATVDKVLLNYSINEATTRHTKATTVNYSDTAKSELLSAILAATAVKDSPSASANEVYTAMQSLQSAVDIFEQTKIYVVDKTTLIDRISVAQLLYNGAIEGNEPGNYAVNSKTDLLDAINTVQAIANEVNTTQRVINNAVATLNTKIRSFEAGWVKDVSVLLQTIATAQELHDNAVEGSQVGNYQIGSKAGLQLAIDAAKAVSDKASLLKTEMESANAALEDAIEAFMSNEVLSSLDNIKRLIKTAKSLLIAAVEGTQKDQYIIGSKAILQTAITVAEKITNMDTEETVVAAQGKLQEAIDAFNAEKIVSHLVLEAAISGANALHNMAVEGTAPGEYAVGSKAVLKSVIEEVETEYLQFEKGVTTAENLRLPGTLLRELESAAIVFTNGRVTITKNLIIPINDVVTAELNVDLSTNLEAPSYRSSGLLHAFRYDGVPSLDMLEPLKVKWNRVIVFKRYPTFLDGTPYEGTWKPGSTQEGGTQWSVVEKGYALGSNTILNMENYSGNNIYTEALIREQIRKAKELGLADSIYWEPTNEPDSINGQEFREEWMLYYNTIREEIPTGKIVGPSTLYYNYNELKGFVLWAKANNVMPDYLSWHFSTDPLKDANELRELLKQNNIVNVKMMINEFLWESDQTSAAKYAWHILRNDRAEIEACPSNWVSFAIGSGNLFENPTTKEIETAGRWWVQKRYADMTGSIVRTIHSDNAQPLVEIIASKDNSKSEIRAILGANGDLSNKNVLVNFNNMDTTPYIQEGGKVKVIVEKISSGVISAPEVVISRTYSVKNNCLEVIVPWEDQHDAYSIVITKPDEKSIVDISGNTMNLATTNATSVDGDTLSFNGNGSLSSLNKLNIMKTSDITLKAKVKITESCETELLNANGVVLGINAEDKAYFKIGQDKVTFDTKITKGEWLEIFATYDSKTKVSALHINGVQVAATTFEGTFTATATSVSIGNGLKGEIDDVYGYNKVLTAAELLSKNYIYHKMMFGYNFDAKASFGLNIIKVDDTSDLILRGERSRAVNLGLGEYMGGWSMYDGGKGLMGPTAYWEFEFKGNAIRYITTMSAGHSGYEVFIDDVSQGIIQPNKPNDDSRILFYVGFEKLGLTEGIHTIRIEKALHSNGSDSFLILDYFEYESHLVDKAALKNVITEAAVMYTISEDEKYEAGARSTLKTALDTAKTLYENEQATAQEVNSGIEALIAAMQTFESSIEAVKHKENQYHK